MDFIGNVIKLGKNPERLAETRTAALSGNAEEMRKYIYHCIWQEILKNKSLNKIQRAKEFRNLVESDLIEVHLGQ